MSWRLLLAILALSLFEVIHAAPQHHHANALEQLGAARVKLDDRVRLSVDATRLERSGDWVTVSWSAVPAPTYTDLLAVFVPADADPRLVAPVKFTAASRSPTHMSAGAGSLRCASADAGGRAGGYAAWRLA